MGLHPSPLGYYSLALAFGNYIDYIIRSNPDDFRKITFVGSNLVVFLVCVKIIEHSTVQNFNGNSRSFFLSFSLEGFL